MQKLSVAILTYNEERNIARCLDALSNIADEMVVVDSFSTDKTAEICAQYKVRFTTHKFEGYGNQKNLALRLCANKYVLFLDANEIVSPQLQNAILEFKNDQTPKDAYTVNRIFHFYGKQLQYAVGGNKAPITLVNKEKAQWTSNILNPKLQLLPKSSRGSLAGSLLYCPYNSFEELISHTNKITSVWANAQFNAGKRSNLFTILTFTPFRFIRDYILLRGFLDAYPGFLICAASAYSVFIRQIKLKQLHLAAKTSKKHTIV